MTRRRIVLIIVGVVVVLLLGVGALLLFAVKIPALSAASALSHYASAIEDGDLAQAAQLAPPGHGGASPVGGSALADPGNRITAVTTRITSSSDRTATGEVSFRLAGATHAATLKLSRGPNQLGILPDWRVTTPLTATISVAVPAGGTALLNGVAAPLGADLKVTVYPGRYAVTLAASNTWYSSSTATVDAAGGTVTAKLDVNPTAALGAEVLKQLKATIDACIAIPDPAPSGCPFSDVRSGTVTGFSWKLSSYPTVSFLDPTHFFYSGGEATADYVYTHAPNIVNRPEEDPVALTGPGSIAFVGPQVKVTLG